MIFNAKIGGSAHEVKIIEDQHGYLLSIDNKQAFHLDVIDRLTGGYTLLVNGKSFDFAVESKDTEFAVLSRGNLFLIDMVNQKTVSVSGVQTGIEKIVAKMPGKIIKIFAEVGDQVKKGQGLVIMEAMKMENELKAPVSGTVTAIHVKVADTVDAGTDLVMIEAS